LTAHNTIADDVSSFVTNVDSGGTKLANVAQNDLVTIAPGYPANKGIAGATYMYLGSAATLDLAHTDYTSGSWRIVGFDTSLPTGPSTKPVSLQNGDRVVITQAALGQPQANGIVGAVYTYVGPSNTTTDLIHTDYTDTTKWTASFTTAPTAPGNTTKNVALQNGALVVISRAAAGQPQANGLIGNLYTYIGTSNTGGRPPTSSARTTPTPASGRISDRPPTTLRCRARGPSRCHCRTATSYRSARRARPSRRPTAPSAPSTATSGLRIPAPPPPT
jgi:hypothetical protein